VVPGDEMGRGEDEPKDDLTTGRGRSLGAGERDLEGWAYEKKIVFRGVGVRLNFCNASRRKWQVSFRGVGSPIEFN
jgi:hypothetical protein